MIKGDFIMNEENMNVENTNVSEENTIVTENTEITDELINNNLLVNETKPIENTNVSEKKNIKRRIILSAVILCLLAVSTLGIIKLKQHKDNINAANSVIEMINNIGEVSVSPEIENKINTASQAYDNLSDKQKQYVSNFNQLKKAKETYKKKDAELKMVILATTCKSAGEMCQAFFSDYSAVWYNAIYRKKDEYNNGDFSDFNKALLAFSTSSTYISASATLNTLNKTIVNTWADLKDSSVENSETYQALKNLYTAYKPMYDLATTPNGSYNSYTKETQDMNSAYKSAYAALTVAMPAIETTATK